MVENELADTDRAGKCDLFDTWRSRTRSVFLVAEEGSRIVGKLGGQEIVMMVEQRKYVKSVSAVGQRNDELIGRGRMSNAVGTGKCRLRLTKNNEE